MTLKIGFCQNGAMDRIVQTHVSALFPMEGPVSLLIYGEAPGPLGADKSGIPFWGDRAGLILYRSLYLCGQVDLDPRVFECWDGATLERAGMEPRLKGVVLSNAWPVCPTRDGQHFCAPTDRMLRSAENVDRVRAELDAAKARCEGKLHLITLGKRAESLFIHLRLTDELIWHPLPHPSAQGLLQAAPDKGRGLRLADLQKAWEDQLMELVKKTFHWQSE